MINAAATDFYFKRNVNAPVVGVNLTIRKADNVPFFASRISPLYCIVVTIGNQ